ncbi:MAG: hypothetical protein N2746_02020 [Deltaproteobacteria bacterium]|nr:hypothetical protein [Deltaproteobacteria bacterium]
MLLTNLLLFAQTGIFEFYVNNQLIGTERYWIQDRMVESVVELNNGYNFRQKTLFDIDGEPNTYIVEGIINNTKVKLDIKRLNAKFAYTAESEIKGKEYFAVLTRAERHAILDNYVASHFLSLIPKLNPNKKNELKVFIPQDGKIKDVTVEIPKKVKIRISGKTIDAYHYNFKLKKYRTVDLYTDYNTGEFLRADIKELKLKIFKVLERGG